MRDRIVHLLQRYTKNGKLPGGDESLFDNGYLDSFALPDFVSGLEDEFKIRVPDSDLNPRKFETLDRIEQYLIGNL